MRKIFTYFLAFALFALSTSAATHLHLHHPIHSSTGTAADTVSFGEEQHEPTSAPCQFCAAQSTVHFLMPLLPFSLSGAAYSPASFTASELLFFPQISFCLSNPRAAPATALA
ncbi:MAG: hypothetical protein IAF08_08525 [Rhizobacter sp.]|nr:hypothetical protein [Chlorobiales bacterium]